MLNRAAAVFVMKVVLIKLMLYGVQVNSAPTERSEEMAETTAGFGKMANPLPAGTVASSVLLKPSPLNPSQHMKCCFLSIKSAGLDRTTKNKEKMTPTSMTTGIMPGRSHTSTDIPRPDNRAKILKMISALAELHKTFNSTMSSQITLISHASSRNPRRKSKVHPAPERGVKTTTATPPALETTASRASPAFCALSLSGRNVRKSLPPQNKKTNKRVCFWKYCSQN
ncbi:hypothetical protein GOODEAATRI_001427 [Goodea atripinnis]|uniref:Urotensin II-related peptide n=1 Tax=Goodea atripinnis TaxID=208336 RepID=A0ABV0N754_9TELE